MSPHPLVDAADRELIATALDDTLVVEAAAGTGKTTELVRRILRILATGRAEVQNIVAVTFTEKAAGELKLRLRAALERERTAASDPAVKERLDAALAGLEEAHVSTIHGFCAELLRERPVEARVDPLFTVLTEAQSERMFGNAFGSWIQEQLADPPDGIRRALRRSVWTGFGGAGTRADGPIDRLRRAAWELAQWRDFTAPWTRRPFAREQEIRSVIDDVHAFAALTEHPSYARDNLFLDTAPARHLSQEIALHQSFGHVDEDGWEARLVDLSRDRTFTRARHGRGPGYRQGVTREAVVQAYEALRARLDQFRMDADADLAAALQQELSAAVERYDRLKLGAGALDFLDLLLKARDLVRGNAGVRIGFQRRFTHLFVDEFQDTDPLQAELLLLLAASDPEVTNWREATPVPGRLFIVGDPKQSIYRFRRADVGIYREVCERLERSGARMVKLTASFRSVPGIQTCVNSAFARVMTGDAFTLQADYVPLSPVRPPLANQPSVVALPVPHPYGSRNVSALAIEQSLPDATAAWVEWLIGESHWTVTERTGADSVPVAARHVCILFRRFISFGADVTMPYVQALEARGVKHVLVGGKTFHDREEVEAIRAALAAIEWPDDELSVFATLRGSLFAIGDEELLDWKHRHRGFHPFRVPAEVSPHLQPIAAALQALRGLHRRRNYIPVAETIHRLLSLTRAHVGFVLRPAGEQALANVLHVAELAREYEASGGISFRGFVEELRLAAETAQAAEAPILEEGSDGVRLMTVHKAKGLEFPVVIVADPTCKLARAEAGRWLDPLSNLCALKIGGWAPIDLVLHDPEEAARDRAEAERLAYVAATRARDLLVVPVIGDGPYEGGWLDPLTPAIYPPEAERRRPARPDRCPPFRSKDSVLNRPGGDPAQPTTVAPGAYRFGDEASDSASRPAPAALRQESHTVVWWDPALLHLDATSTFGLRRDDLIVKDGDRVAVEDRLAAYESWRADRERLVAEGAVPAMRVLTATAWAADAARAGIDDAIAASAAIDVVRIDGAEGRPKGPAFGSLVHATLATVSLDADPEAVMRTAEVQGRILNATAGDVRAAAAVVRAVLQHDLMSRARAAARVRREAPVTWTQPDGTLIEGVLDLAFDEGDRTIVIDFKTDHELSAGEARYRAQLQKYVDAVALATGRATSGVLFKV